MEANGKVMIKVVSILFIISGSLSTALYGISLFLGGAGAAADIIPGQVAGVSMVLGLMVLYLVWALVMLVCGIMGLKYSTKPQAAKKLITMGIILLILTLIVNGYRVASTGVDVSALLSLVASLVLPSLYIWGAKKNQQ